MYKTLLVFFIIAYALFLGMDAWFFVKTPSPIREQYPRARFLPGGGFYVFYQYKRMHDPHV